MKNVQNLISYLHEFSWNFYQSLAIYLELFSFGVNFNSEIADTGDPPVSLPLSAPRLKGAVGTVRHRPNSCRLPTAPSPVFAFRQHRPDSSATRLASRATIYPVRRAGKYATPPRSHAVPAAPPSTPRRAIRAPSSTSVF
jgi:hypothetical protein